MPIYNASNAVLPPNTAAFQLMKEGMTLAVEIDISASFSHQLTTAQAAVPSPIPGQAVIDTGAAITCVKEECLIKLGLMPIGKGSVSTPVGNHVQNFYLARLIFPGAPLPPLELPVVGIQLVYKDIVALIGRDILSQCALVYNGPLGSYMLAF